MRNMKKLNKPINLTNAWIKNAKAPNRYDSIQGDLKVKGLKIRITKNGSKTFYYYYKAKKTGRQGKYRIGAFSDIGVPEARKIAENLAAEVRLGGDPQAEKVAARKQRKEEKKKAVNDRIAKLGVFLDEKYYPWAESHQKAPWNTKAIMKRNFEFLYSKRMDEISSWVIDKWQKAELDKGNQPATVNRALSALMAVLNKAVERKVIDENPLAGRKAIKTDKKGVIRWLSEDEEKRLYKAISKRTGHLPVIITLLLNTGARPKEIFTLRWENVDLENRSITLEAAFTKTGQTRYIPLNDTAFNALSNWESEGEWVFPGVKYGTHIVSINRGWRYIKKEANIKNLRLYDLRHSFASKLVRNGVSIYEVAELLGHSAVEMTKIYAHLDDQTLRNAVAKVG